MQSAHLLFNTAAGGNAFAQTFKISMACRAGTLAFACGCALTLPLAATGQPQIGVSLGAPASATSSAPATISVPPDERVAFTWGAVGTQNYECKANDKGTFAWVFTASEADLLGTDKARAGTHGAGPVWLALDGSRVTGSVKARAGAPARAGSAAAIPWLLLATQSTGSAGRLASVTHIQRINTTGGVAPPSGCADAADAGQQAKVGYTADYVFYVRQ